MPRLATIQHGLAKVRRVRAVVRLGSAWAVFVAGLLAALAAAFLLDWALDMGRLERGIVLLAAMGGAVWAFGRWVRPALRVQENDLALALLVERQQGLSSDLVAALQFDDAQRVQFGSGDLREAVIEYTDEAARNFDFLEGFSRRELHRRMGVLSAALAAVLVPALIFSGHTLAFLDRFFLGHAHYPTNTIIQKVLAPGSRAPYGRPVVFRVQAAQKRGAWPERGRVNLQARGSGLTTALDLLPDPKEPGVYTGRLSRALDDLEYTVHLGDAYTDPAVVKLIPLPLVKIDWQVQVPAYAAARFRADTEGGRLPVVLEGARAVPVVTADKRLTAAVMTIGGVAYRLRADGDRFVLDGADSPLALVTETVRYELQVTDADGLALETPLVGLLQVRPDQPPRIMATAVTHVVLPTATPTVGYRALDDYGIAKVVLHRAVTRAEGKQEEHELVVAQPAERPVDTQPQLLRVPLTDLNLAPGDRVTVTLEAIDYRGALPGKATRSESVSFGVTDRAGVLAALHDMYEQLDKKMDDVIKAHLGLGG